MKIIFINKQKKHDMNFDYFKQVVEIFIDERLKKFKKYDSLELFISFVSPQKIKNLKKELFNLNIVTDVIAVPMDTEDINKKIPTVFGEIFICPETADRQRKFYKKTFDDEITLLIVHGLLHLIGYKDSSDEDIKKMRQEEQKNLRAISSRLV